MNQMIASTINSLIDELNGDDPKSGVTSILGDLVPLQAFYVTASAALQLEHDPSPHDIARAVLDSTESLVVPVERLLKDIRRGDLKTVVDSLNKMDLLIACSMIAMACEFPDVAGQIADHCRSIYENADLIGQV